MIHQVVVSVVITGRIVMGGEGYNPIGLQKYTLITRLQRAWPMGWVIRIGKYANQAKIRELLA
jgi:hypothetical protein